jgi:hypothetical protein
MSYQLISESKPKARKEHACIWCNEKILKGETYIHEVSKYEGDLQNHHWHPECQTACEKFFKEWGEWEFPPGEFKRGTMDPK